MRKILDFPPQTIRDTIIEVLSTYETPMTVTELTEHMHELLELTEPIHSEQQTQIQNIIDDMVASGRLKQNSNTYNLGDTRKNGDETTYHVTHLESPSENPIIINGSNIVNTIGSEYYQEAWEQIFENETTVELIPEPENPYDSNAVAVTINNQIVGHLTRTQAEQYIASITQLNESGYSLQVTGQILSSPTDPNYRYIQLAMPSTETIKNHTFS